MPARVSVIVPTYNQAEYLPACLDSLMFQEYPLVEILVVNDGATDATAEVLETYQAALPTQTASYASCYREETDEIERVVHPRYPGQKGGQAGEVPGFTGPQERTLNVITHARNRGLAPALNTGVAHATGEYVTYVPSDDVCYPNMLAELVEPLDAGADMAYADMHIVTDEGRILRRFALPDYTFQAAFGDWYFCGVCKLYRRELHQRLGGYDEALLAHDHELFQRFAEAGARLVHVPKTLMAVRDHDQHRKKDIHAPSSWNRLLEESKVLVTRARAFLADERDCQDE